MNIDKCPICGGELQATVERQTWYTLDRDAFGSSWAVEIVEGRDGSRLIDFEPDDEKWIEVGQDTTAMTIYCENDHTEDEMVAALDKAGAR